MSFIYTQLNGQIAHSAIQLVIPEITQVEFDTQIELVGSLPNREYRSAWRISGNTVIEDAVEKLSISSKDKIEQVKIEAISRISAIIPAINTWDMIMLMKELWSTLDTASASANLISVKNIGVYAIDKIAELESADQTVVDSYDKTTDINWPT